MRITAYRFGEIVIDGKTYTSDVIVYPDRVEASWWRKEGHLLQEADLEGVVTAEPETLVVGTGANGVMHVPEGTVRLLESRGITVIVEKTGKAVETFNRRSTEERVVGAFHLTC